MQLWDEKCLSNAPRIHTGCATQLLFARVYFLHDTGREAAKRISDKWLQSLSSDNSSTNWPYLSLMNASRKHKQCRKAADIATSTVKLCDLVCDWYTGTSCVTSVQNSRIYSSSHCVRTLPSTVICTRWNWKTGNWVNIRYRLSSF